MMRIIIDFRITICFLMIGDMIIADDVGLILEAVAFLGTGAFDINFFRCMWKKDYSCPHTDIDFIMFSTSVPNGRYINAAQPKSLNYAGYRKDRETTFIIHGFNGTAIDKHMRYLKDAYLSRKFNVIMVDWKKLTYYPCYLPALSNTRLVAQCTAQVYAFLTIHGMPKGRITCVGHSLGAHICGMVSKHLTIKPYKIIGLDPARPLIENHASDSYRLTADDADIVQVIHTNSGTLGQLSLSGSLDLCVNGGRFQPYCRGDPIRSSRCSHFLSVCYLANAIFKHKLFPYVPCPNGCEKFSKELFLKKKVYGTSSNIVRLMHIGQDVPDTFSGAYCVRVDFAKHCPFND